jgi:hypothetical protein
MFFAGLIIFICSIVGISISVESKFVSKLIPIYIFGFIMTGVCTYHDLYAPSVVTTNIVKMDFYKHRFVKIKFNEVVEIKEYFYKYPFYSVINRNEVKRIDITYPNAKTQQIDFEYRR